MRLLPFCLALLPAALPVTLVAQNPAATPYAAESLVVEHLATVYTFAADGTGSRHLSAATRIQSDAAAREYSVLTIPFAGDAEQVEVTSVRVLHPDGSVTLTPPADAQILPQPVTREAPFYSDLKELQLPVRSLSTGDRLEYDAVVHILHPEAPGYFWGQDSFVDRYVVLDQTTELHLPRTGYSKVWSPAHPPVMTETATERVYTWKTKHLDSSVKADGTAADTPELDPKGTLPDIAWTSFHDWAEVGAWYSALSAGRSAPDDTIRAKVSELTAGKPTLDAKQHAVYDFVATDIRYIGVAFGVGRYQPHSASEILRNQYGDCKDKHTLLAAMLAVLGTPPDAVLIGAGIRFNPDVPSPSAFNHLITALPTAPAAPIGKDTVWLDTTAEVAPWGMLMTVIRDHEALVVPPASPAAVARTPSDPPFKPFGSFIAKGTLDPSGTAHAHIDWTERGDGEILLRALLRQVPPAKWPDLAQGLSHQLGFSGTTSHVDAARPELTSAPARLSYDYEREKLGDWDSLRIVPLLPVIFIPDVDEKKPPKFAIQLGEPHIETNHTDLKLPAGWKADLPAAVHEHTAFVTFDKTYALKDGTLSVDRKLEVLTREIPAADWRAYKKWYNATLKEGEPYIQLHTADGSTTQAKATIEGSKPGVIEALPAPSTTPSEFILEAKRDIARHRFDLAQPLLDKLRAANPQQPELWATFGFMAFQQFHFAEAIDDYIKELAISPDTDWVYIAMVDAQVSLGRRDDARATLRRDLTRKPDDLTIVGRLATLQSEDGDPKGAVATLQAAITKLGDTKPDDLLRIQLAGAQLAANDPQGRSTLRSILHQSSDPNVLNDAAYTLSVANQDLAQAEVGARRALDLLADQTATQTLSEITPAQAALSRLTVATWDTLGELLVQQAKPDEAEPFLRAAWRLAPNAETGLHLAQLEERRGRKQAALDLYELAADREHADLLRSQFLAPATNATLASHRDALRASGLKPSFEYAAVALAEQHMIPAGKTASKQGSADFLLLIQSGKIIESRLAPNHPQTGIPEASQLIAATDVSSWTPAASSTRMLLAASLACDQSDCKLVLQPF